MRLIGSSVAVAGGLAVALAAGCTRDPAPAECPAVAPGDIVVTEVRGPQSPDDALGTWIELYNASDASIDLEGIKIRFRKKDGSSEVPVLVRRSLTVDPGEYVTLGLVNDDATRPAHIDYGFATDFHVGFLPAAAIDVEACGVQIDRATYDVLPKTGTYSFGTSPPTANDNDVPAGWCTNAMSEGTPKQANPPCP